MSIIRVCIISVLHISTIGLLLYCQLLAARGDRRKPNIVIVIADDLGWSDISYNKVSRLIKTPYIDRLIKDGVRLENHYVQPICSPTRASLLTGRYSYKLGAGLDRTVFDPADDSGLPLKHKTLPEKLKEKGYRTHLVGKWHLGASRKSYLPLQRGFDSFYGFYNGAIDYYKHNKTDYNCEKEGIDSNFIDLRDQDEIVNKSGVYSAQLYGENLKLIISKKTIQPLFLVASYQLPHEPLQVPRGFQRRRNITRANSGEDLEDRETYAQMVSFLDESVWNITVELKRANIWNNTILLFFSDNGGDPQFSGYNWPLRGMKRTLWEGGIKSVSFLHGGYLPRHNFNASTLIHVSDWLPTIMHLLDDDNVKSRLNLDGDNVWESIFNPAIGSTGLTKTIIHNIFNQNYAVRQGEWKLISDIDVGWAKPPDLLSVDFTPPAASINASQFSGYVHDLNHDRVENALFNIRRDPFETVNLKDQFPSIVKQLLNIVNKNRLRTDQRHPPAICNQNMIDQAKSTGAWGPLAS